VTEYAVGVKGADGHVYEHWGEGHGPLSHRAATALVAEWNAEERRTAMTERRPVVRTFVLLFRNVTDWMEAP
jgi:hypothetical protein